MQDYRRNARILSNNDKKKILFRRTFILLFSSRKSVNVWKRFEINTMKNNFF